METNNDPINQFINQILDEKKIPGETPEVRAELVVDLRNQLMQQIDRAMINALSSDQVDELNQMLDDPNVDDQKLQQFMAESGVDGQQVATRVMIEFRKAYLGN